MQEYREALYRMRRGESDRQISRDGVLGRNKLGRLRSLAVQEGWLDPATALPNEAVLLESLTARRQAQIPVVGAKQSSSVTPFIELIERWHSQGVHGVAIHAALARNNGYTGHYSSVRRYLTKIKDRRIDATMILDFAPGEAAQIDFGAGPLVFDASSRTLAKTWFFVMTLCFSRHQYVEFVRDQTVATWLKCHHHALRHFGGTPKRLIIDNPKCAITRAVVDDPEVQRAYAETAEGYGFLVSPCPPADPAKKGRVESGVKYIKNNFLPLREFVDLNDINRQVGEWVMHSAGQRIHGTTRETPIALFDTERAYLQALPARPPEVCTWSRVKVHRDSHVQVDYCLYSVPFKLIGSEVMARATSGMVEVFNLEHGLVASHLRCLRRGQHATLDDHLPPAAQAWKMRTPRYCLQQAEAIGPACLALVTRLFGDRVLDRLRNVQGLLRLAEKFGDDRLEAACLVMKDVDIVSVRTARLMLEKGLDRAPAKPTPPSPVYQGKGRFARKPVTQTQFDLQ